MHGIYKVVPDWMVENLDVNGDAMLASPSLTTVFSASSKSLSILSIRATLYRKKIILIVIYYYNTEITFSNIHVLILGTEQLCLTM